MIALNPRPDAYQTCPYCNVPLEVRGWYIPGMRTLGQLRCTRCDREYYGDLPSGHGLYVPCLLEKQTSVLHNRDRGVWFANLLRDSYVHRTTEPLEFSINEHRAIRQKPLLLNCIDYLYGHCLLKLINAQYYLDHRPDLDLIVLVPDFLKWMVPEGIAQTWSVNLSLRQGAQWNDWLANQLSQLIDKLQECSLSVAFSHPHANNYDIARFTRVQPFPIADWDVRLEQPKLTFIWRDDRVWYTPDHQPNGQFARISGKLKRHLNLSTAPVEHQRRRFLTLANALRQKLSGLDVAIVGLGQRGGFPSWIHDLRTTKIDEAIERSWCERYAVSHIVLGVHGSNMLLPSAHAGATIELVPPDRWGNIMQATLFRRSGVRESVYRYRYIPLNTSVDDLGSAIYQLLMIHKFMTATMPSEVCDHTTLSRSTNSLLKLRLFEDFAL